ncbi:MAG: ABC transporter ATP-binding protein [Aquisalimonadaceae bacterium]
MTSMHQIKQIGAATDEATLAAGPLLSAAGISSGYGGNMVLRDVAFALQPGEVCGVIGPNGAGKTTLLSTLYGLLPLATGNVCYAGEDISALTPQQRRLRGVSYVPQENNVFPNLTVVENMELALTGRPELRKARRFGQRLEYIFNLFPRLAERRKQPAGLMSGGEQRMVAISIGLMAEPRVLLLDEPTTGLAPNIVHQLMETIQTLNRTEAISTIIVEQNIMAMLRIVNSLYLMKDGRSRRYEGAPEDIAKQKIWEYL